MSERTDSDNIADILVRDIFSGHYQPGNFIPKEMQLCEQFGLSRTVVRRHLAELVAGGIIERISGYGSRVCEYAQWRILDPRVTSWLTRFASANQEIQREILKFRLMAEPYVAMIAARNATAHDLQAIETAFNGMGQNLQQASGNGAHQLHNDFDVAFHMAIFHATHNIVWTQLSHILRPSIHLLVAESNTSASDPEQSLERHRQLMDSIRMRRPRVAYHAAQAILQGTSAALGLQDTTAPTLDDWLLSGLPPAPRTSSEPHGGQPQGEPQ